MKTTCTTQPNFLNKFGERFYKRSVSERHSSFNGEPGRIRTFSDTIWKRIPLASRDSDSWPECLSCRNLGFQVSTVNTARALEEAGRLELPRVFTPVVFKTMCSADLHRFHWRSRSESNRELLRLQRRPMPYGSRSKFTLETCPDVKILVQPSFDFCNHGKSRG